MKHKLLFLLASLLLPLAASAYDACINGIYYNIVKKAKQATVTYGDSESGTYSGNVVIPATVNYDGTTCNVIAIGEYAFRGCALTSLSIPASITTIGLDAFEYASVNQLHINDIAAWCNITFGKYDSKPIACSKKLFINGKETTNLVIPDGVTKISDYAFYKAKMLTSVSIPGSVVEIGIYAFSRENKYASVTIDNRNLVSIGERAFESDENHTIENRFIIDKLYITDLAAWCSNISFHGNPIETSDKLFVNGKEIHDLVIPDGVTTISAYAFWYGKMITSVSIPNSVTEIGSGAFSGTNIESITIPDGVQIIDCLGDNNNLKNLTIGRGVRKMGNIMDFKSLENIYISDLTGFCKIVIHERPGSTRDPFVRAPKQTPMKASSDTRNVRLFLNGKELKDLVVPKDIFDTTDDMVVYTGDSYYICDAFYGISSLESVIIPEDAVPEGISCQIGGGYNAGFRNCPNLKTIKNETNLRSLYIVDCEKVETIVLGKYTKWCDVYGCKELADVYCDGMPNGANFGVDCQVEYATLHVPEILMEKYRTYSFTNAANYTFYKNFGNIVALKPGDPGYVANPDNTPITFSDTTFGTTAIANFDFDGDGKLSKYEASLVTEFGKVFQGNKDIKTLEDLKYFTSMLTINEYAFVGCSGITSVTIPNFITSIGKGAFADSGLISITIPTSVACIDNSAFKNCDGLTSFTVPNSVTYIGENAFCSCEHLTSITIPNSVVTIGEDAFRYCNNLNAVYIADLAAWCRIAFVAKDMSGSLSYQSNPLYYGGCLYLNNKKVTELVIPSSVTTISAGAFYCCCGLISVTIPSSVTSIGKYAFSSCSSLTSVTIPNSVTSIREGAFAGNKNLAKVRSMIEQPFAVDENVFRYYDNGFKFTSATLYVPHGTKAKYQSTDGWKNFTTIIETDFEDQPKGDVNGDGVVDVADIATVISVMAKGNNDLSADVNGDGVVDVADIATIISEMAANARKLSIED